MRRPDRDCCTVCTPKCRRHHQLIKLVISLQGGGLREIIHGLKIFSVFFFPLSVPSLYLAVRILRCPTLCSSVFNKVIAFLMILTGTFILQLNFKLKFWFYCSDPVPCQHVPLYSLHLGSPHFRRGQCQRGGKLQSLFSVPDLRYKFSINKILVEMRDV